MYLRKKAQFDLQVQLVKAAWILDHKVLGFSILLDPFKNLVCPGTVSFSAILRS